MEEQLKGLKVFLIISAMVLSACLFNSKTFAANQFTNIKAKPLLQMAANKFVYNPRTLRWKAIKNGRVIRSGRGSGGASYCKDVKRACRTPTGSFRIISKRGKHCKSSKYPLGKGGAPMPYCMFFSKYYAIHGSPDVPGRNASHGCIRVKPSAARWLYNNFLKIGTRVVVKPY